MKKLLSVSLLMLCLSFPVFAGHTLTGGAYCEPCDNVQCICDGQGGNRARQQDKAPTDATAEIGILLVALLFWLRLKS
jgi:hypothetical protein